MNAQRKHLLLFAKRPVPGQVKSRLAKSIGEHAAAQFYSQLLFRNIKEISNLRAIDRWVLSSKKSDELWFWNKVKTLGWQTSYQSEGDIGERMLEALTRFSKQGVPTIVVGSDLVDLSFKDIELAFHFLEGGNTCVLGPSDDGGYWLIGFNSVVPSVFDYIPWSTMYVLEHTLEKIKQTKLKLKMLPVRTDIDDIHDLTDFYLRA
jgi:rSAM/selenodomain-associated transferase 1